MCQNISVNLRMISYFNVIFLFFLAIISWILLCIINPEPIYQKFQCIKEHTKSRDFSDIFKLCINSILTIFKKGPNLSVYLIFILLGVFILVNVIARKVKTIAMAAARNEGFSNLLVEISHLKKENAMLVTSLKQHKQKKEILLKHIEVNAALIQKLKTEQSLMKQKYKLVKRKLVSFSKQSNTITEESSNTSASYHEKSQERLTQSYFIKGKCHNEYFNNPVFALKNRDIFNEIIKEAYGESNYVLCSKGNSSPNISNDYLLYEEDITSIDILKDLNNINIVSTEELQKMKGTSHPSFLPKFK